MTINIGSKDLSVVIREVNQLRNDMDSIKRKVQDLERQNSALKNKIADLEGIEEMTKRALCRKHSINLSPDNTCL
jgi:uncharacterized protein YlxW (UPF0749 family)